MLDEVLAALGLLDLLGPGQQALQIAVLADQLGRGLDADARDAGHVVHRVARQGLDLDHLVGRHAELLHHLLGADLEVLHGVEHGDAVADQLHQVLVGGHHGDPDALRPSLLRVGRDQVVGLEVGHLDARQVEGPGRLADHLELRDQVFRRIGPLGLVVRIDLVSEGVGALVEDHRQAVGIALAQQLDQHVGKAEGRVGRRAVRGVARRDREIGPEDVARAVDQVEVLVGSGGGHGPGILPERGWTVEGRRRPLRTRAVAARRWQETRPSIRPAEGRRAGPAAVTHPISER